MGNASTARRTGSVRQQANGRWLATLSHGTKVDGSRRTFSKTFDKRAEAESWLVAKSVELGKCPQIGAGITLSALWEAYKANRLPELAKTTQVTYRQRMEAVVDALGKRDVSSITHGDIQRLVDGMRPSVAQKTATALSAVLTFGVRNNLLTENVLRHAPLSYGDAARYADPEDNVWNDDPFAAIEGGRDVWDANIVLKCMERIRGLPLEPVWLACVGAGLRVEEAFALRKMDVRRIVATYDELGHEIWVTQLAIHHASTREERRKTTKTTRSVGIVPMLEPFGERLWELVEALPRRDSPICRLEPTKQNRNWRLCFEKPPEEWPKHTPVSRVVRGSLHGLPYIPLSRMRATHTTLVQEAGVLDSLNRSWHRNTGAVQQRHYMSPDLTQTALEVSRMIR